MSENLLPSITAYRKTGVCRKLLQNLTNNSPVIPEIYRDCFSRYYLLYWSPDYVLEKMKQGIIIHDGISYYAFMSPSLSRTKIAFMARQMKMSFRAPIPEFDIPAAVYIS